MKQWQACFYTAGAIGAAALAFKAIGVAALAFNMTAKDIPEALKGGVIVPDSEVTFPSFKTTYNQDALASLQITVSDRGESTIKEFIFQKPDMAVRVVSYLQEGQLEYLEGDRARVTDLRELDGAQYKNLIRLNYLKKAILENTPKELLASGSHDVLCVKKMHDQNMRCVVSK